MHLAPLIRDLAVILGVAGIVSLIFHRIRQPVVLGYIVAGLIVGPYTLPFSLVSDVPSIKIWAELGIIFLMFSLGLEFSFRKLAKVGISAGLTACFEVTSMLFIGFGTGKLLGWRTVDCVFLGAMLAISSTTIIIKALDELKLKTRRFSEVIFGVLIVEDLFAILILVALSTGLVTNAFSGMALLGAAGRLILVTGSWFIAGYLLIPGFVRYVGRKSDNEMLTIVSIALCLFLVVFAAHFGYSVALGAFIMGSIIAESTESHRIEDRMEPLRDLFAAVFFISVGMLMDPAAVLPHIGSVILITIIFMISKITAITVGALITGQTLRTSVQVGFGLAQIGEFSFIIATLGMTLGVTSSFLFPIAVAVSLITTFTTPYLIRISHRFAVWLEARLPLRLKDLLSRYAAWTQERRADTAHRREFYRGLVSWIINGIVVTALFVIAREVLLPFIRTRTGSHSTARLIAWGIAALLSTPFLSAMVSAFKGFYFGPADSAKTDVTPRGGTVFAFRLFTLAWLAALSAGFFPIRYVLLISIVGVISFFVLFYRQIANSYRWFENRFLSTFEPMPKSKAPTDVLRHLAPWDAHLVRIKVHPNAEIAAKRIADARLRTRFGLNVVAIQRGLKTVVAPGPDELILPKDELLVLGTDEQVESVRSAIERPPGLEDRFRRIAGYELRQIRVAGKTIRESQIRERFGAMVVGLERAERREINPESDTVLVAGNVLWIVGEKENLDKMTVALPEAPGADGKK